MGHLNRKEEVDEEKAPGPQSPAQEGGAQEGGAQAAISPHTRQRQWCDSIPFSWRRLYLSTFYFFTFGKLGEKPRVEGIS